MSLQSTLTAMALPPLLLLGAAMGGAVLALRYRRAGVAMVLLTCAGVLLLATPMAEALLRVPLERAATAGPLPQATAGAIIVLGAEVARSSEGLEVGPLTLERLRAGAALHRRTGLPLLVTGGPLSAGDVPLAEVMQHSLDVDFRVPVRWVEGRAPDTRGNAEFSATLLRANGISMAYLVTHAWHMPRAREAFERAGFAVIPAPVRIEGPPDAQLSDWVPRPDHLASSWYMIREWVGRLVYALRDG